MEIVPFIVAAVCTPFAVLFLSFWILARWHRGPLHRVAVRVGGRLQEASWFELPTIQLRLDNFEAVVAFVGSDRADSETLFRVPWPDSQLQCELRQPGVVGRIFSLLEARPIELAAPLLDNTYAVSGNDEAQIRRLFSARVQSVLLQLAPLAPNPRRHPDVRLTIEDGLLTVVKASHILDEVVLEDFIRLCAELHQAALDATGCRTISPVPKLGKSCA